MTEPQENSRLDLVTALTKAVAALAQALLARGASDVAVALVDAAVTLETEVVLAHDHVDVQATALLTQLDSLRDRDVLTDRVERCRALTRSLCAMIDHAPGHPSARVPMA